MSMNQYYFCHYNYILQLRHYMMLKNNFLIDTIANLTSRRWKLITSICSDNCILCFTCFFHKVALYNKYNTKTGIDHMKSADIPPVLFLWTWSYYPSLHSYSAPCIMLICHGSQPGNIINNNDHCIHNHVQNIRVCDYRRWLHWLEYYM